MANLVSYESMPVRMTRRVMFSSGHRYWDETRSPEENKTLYGRWASPFNHGHNYLLYVTVEGGIDPETGMVVNIKVIDEIVQRRVVSRFDNRSINDEIPEFKTKSSSLENILEFIWMTLSEPGVLPDSANLVSLRLDETALLYAEKDTTTMTTLTRIYEFAAAHRLNAPSLSLAENIDLFGKCNNPAGHGHNYVLEVTVGGIPDPVTGMLVGIDELDRAVQNKVVDRYDHKNLNVDVPEFLDVNTTSEVVAQTIFSRLSGHLPGKLVRIRLHETARNIFEVSAAGD